MAVYIEKIFDDPLEYDEMRVYRVTDSNGFGYKIPTDMKVITDQSKRAYRVYEKFTSNHNIPQYNHLYILIKGVKYMLTPIKGTGQYEAKLTKVPPSYYW